MILAALYNIGDISVQLQAMSSIELCLEISARKSTQQMLSPLKDFVFLDSSQDAFQSAPMSHITMRTCEETLLARGKILFPNGVALLLRTAKKHSNKASIQGGFARIILAMCEHGGAEIAHKICSCTAFETLHGLPTLKGTPGKFALGNIKCATLLGRSVGKHKLTGITVRDSANICSSKSREEAHANALRERVAEIKQRIRDKFNIQVPELGVGSIPYRGKAGGMRQDHLDGGDMHLAPTVRISFLRAY